VVAVIFGNHVEQFIQIPGHFVYRSPIFLALIFLLKLIFDSKMPFSSFDEA